MEATDDHTRIEFAIALYPNTAVARVTLIELIEIHHRGTIDRIDAAVPVRDADGALTITERGELIPGRVREGRPLRL